eukprot:SAG31_NODE_2510_length_5586_cov_2.799344_4_plen_535_part_00
MACWISVITYFCTTYFFKKKIVLNQFFDGMLDPAGSAEFRRLSGTLVGHKLRKSTIIHGLVTSRAGSTSAATLDPAAQSLRLLPYHVKQHPTVRSFGDSGLPPHTKHAAHPMAHLHADFPVDWPYHVRRPERLRGRNGEEMKSFRRCLPSDFTIVSTDDDLDGGGDISMSAYRARRSHESDGSPHVCGEKEFVTLKYVLCDASSAEKSALAEIHIMERLPPHPCLQRLLDHYYTRVPPPPQRSGAGRETKTAAEDGDGDVSDGKLQRQWLVMALDGYPDGTLSSWCRRTEPNGLSLERQVRAIAQQLLAGLAVVHAARICHRAVQPRHCFLQQKRSEQPLDSNEVDTLKFDVKLGAFGSAVHQPSHSHIGDAEPGYEPPCFSSDSAPFLPPEAFGLASTPRGSTATSYFGQAGDIWSVGAVLWAVLARRAPAFCFASSETGANDAQHRSRFAQLHASVTDSNDDTDDTYQLPTSDLSKSGQDLLSSLLQPEPALRPSAAQALHHPWFQLLISNDSNGKTCTSSHRQSKRRRRKA